MNSCTPDGKGFKMVPHLNVSDPYEAYHPSIAGRHLKGNPKMSVAWWDNANQDVYTKDFTWCDASFRKPITKQVNTDVQIIDALENILYPNPTHNSIQLRLNQWKPTDLGSITVHDISGRMVKQAQGNKMVLENATSTLFMNLKPGMYILRAITTFKQPWSAKVVKQ